MAGTLGSQILALLLIPFVTRLYSVSNFGVMTTFSTVVTTISVISCLCFEQAIVLPKKNEKSFNIMAASFLCCISISLFTFILIFFFEVPLSDKLFKVDNIIWLVPVAIFLSGLRLIFNYWATRKRKFTSLSIANFSSSLGNQGTKIISGLIYGDRIGGLIAGVIGYALSPTLILGSLFAVKEFRHAKQAVSKKDITSVFKKYKNFPLYATWNELLVNIGRSIPIFFLAYIYGNNAVGAFGLANNTLRVPIGVVANSVRQVYLQKAASLHAEGEKISRFMMKNTFALLFIGIIPFGFLMFFAPDLFILVFGKDWLQAGHFTRILSPWLLTLFILPPTTVSYTVLQKQNIRLIFYIVSCIAQIFCFLVGLLMRLDVYYTLLLLSVICSIINIIKIYTGYRLTIIFEK